MSNAGLSVEDLDWLRGQGWEVRGDTFVGQYRGEEVSCDGIIQRENGTWQFYILDCPDSVLLGMHGACLRRRSSLEKQTRHWVHFNSGAPGPVAGIMAINRIIGGG